MVEQHLKKVAEDLLLLGVLELVVLQHPDDFVQHPRILFEQFFVVHLLEGELVVRVILDLAEDPFDVFQRRLSGVFFDNTADFFVTVIDNRLVQVLLHSPLVKILQAVVYFFGRVFAFLDLKIQYRIAGLFFVHHLAQQQRQHAVEGVGVVGDVVVPQDFGKAVEHALGLGERQKVFFL